MKAGHRATFAADEVLSEHSFSKESVPEKSSGSSATTVDVLRGRSGWEFSSRHGSILNEAENITLAEGIKKSLTVCLPSLQRYGLEWFTGDSLEINKCKLHTPPMLFGRDFIEIKIGGSILSLNACDAILCWAAQHSEEEITKHPLAEIKVPYASNWIKKTRTGLDAVAAESATEVVTQELHSDWTYSSDYVCSLLTHSKSDGMDNRIGTVLRARELPLPQISSSATPSVLTGFRSIFPVPQEDQPATNNQVPGWRVTCVAESGIDYAILRKQDEPILFYDELLLYQDDLEDCGEIIFEAKIRVMPSCWFLLTKQYLRVDGVLVRCREGRFFHNFCDEDADVSAGQKIHMEVCWRELTAPEQSISSVPLTHVAATHTSQGVGNIITAVPTGVRAHPGVRPPMPIPPMCTGADHKHTLLNTTQGRNMTHLLPMVNERENIPQFYTLSTTM